MLDLVAICNHQQQLFLPICWKRLSPQLQLTLDILFIRHWRKLMLVLQTDSFWYRLKYNIQPGCEQRHKIAQNWEIRKIKTDCSLCKQHHSGASTRQLVLRGDSAQNQILPLPSHRRILKGWMELFLRKYEAGVPLLIPLLSSHLICPLLSLYVHSCAGQANG